MEGDTSSVQVAVRVRPMLAAESGSTQCLEVLQSFLHDDKKNIVRIGGEKGPTFTFDQAFDANTSQSIVFEQRIVPLVDSCLEGYNATVLAYGQTGSGKTHTIMGPATAMEGGEHAGVIPRAIRNLFDKLKDLKMNCEDSNPSDEEKEQSSVYDFEVRVQFLELYGEEIRDLLTSKPASEKLAIRDIGMEEPEVLGATQEKIDCAGEALLCITRGMLRRVTGETAMNASSSRSHAIMSIMVEQSTSEPDGGHISVRRSKFNFVDLAGSERQKRTKAEGQRLREGIEINKGLLVLGNVISALGDPKKNGHVFVPYRDSKLTRLLKGSLGGNHKTLMIACVSPSSNNLEESLNCLRYANRAKNIQNKAIVNVDAGTRMVAELRGQVQELARELLRFKQGDALGNEAFTLEKLQAIAGGKADVVQKKQKDRKKSTAMNGAAAGGHAVQTALENKLAMMTSQLQQTKEKLEETSKTLKSTTEDLFSARAEKELYRLRLENGDQTYEPAYFEKIAAYEKELESLRREARNNIPVSPELRQNFQIVQKAHETLETEKNRLHQVQQELSSLRENQATGTPVTPKFYEPKFHSDQLDSEEAAEEAQLSEITNRFLSIDDSESHTEALNDGILPVESIDEVDRRREQLEANLVQISKSIDEKEGLIEQLEVSQKKYQEMRNFYEEKLRKMEEQVKEREAEREALLLELKKREDSNSDTVDLRRKLKDKESHIAGLKRRQNELVRLKKVSSRNEDEISRLKNEITEMKSKKVELRKMISVERKSHLGEIQRLKKQVLQSDKQANKWKKVSDMKTNEAAKAQQIAKSRLDQLGQLSKKYKEAERKVRISTVKRGVMERAGLDTVIVGRRSTSTGRKGPNRTANGVNIDSVRSFLDQKIADVARKEAIADKLAHEWEDHLELNFQKEDLAQEMEKEGSAVSADSIDAIDVQLKYKEERIRQLAKRLGKKGKPHIKPVETEFFLEEKEFKALHHNSSSLAGARLATKVLFGMVVRERRRVASLARTASSLHEKAVEADRAAASKDAAFRSYMEEERHERASMAQSQHEQILSLMALVKEGDNNSVSSTNTVQTSQSEIISSTSPEPQMLLLANKRIDVLERQLSELEGEREAKDMYKQKESETRSTLSAVEEQCTELRKDANLLRSSLRQIREELMRHSVGNESQSRSSDHGNEELDSLRCDILNIVMDALHPTSSRRKAKRGKDGREFPLTMRPKMLSPRLQRHVELMHTSDSEDDEENPTWAGDIMADLSVIAEDKFPSSRANSSNPPEHSNEHLQRKSSNDSVFDRLTNPDNFTGVQKRKTAKVGHPRDKRNASKEKKAGKEERKVMAQSVQEILDKTNVPDLKTPDKSHGDKSKKKDDDDHHRSVFERLMSPSMYTGTQKGRIQMVQAKKSQQAEQLLDNLLDGDVRAEPNNEQHDGGPKKSIEVIDITAQVASRVSGYTQQNVFERLQRTTTQSYAVKHHSGGRASTSPLRQLTNIEEEITPSSKANESYLGSPSRSEEGRQNVFERLQRMTTLAFAQKQNAGQNNEGEARHDQQDGHKRNTKVNTKVSSERGVKMQAL